MLSFILASFLSYYTDPGDFPKDNYSSRPKVLRKTDKNALVATAAAIGELYWGMGMTFDPENPTFGTPLEPWMGLVRKCREQTMAYNLPESAMMANIHTGLCWLIDHDYKWDYNESYTSNAGAITVLGVSTNLYLLPTNYPNVSANLCSTDLRTELKSNCKRFLETDKDIALFRAKSDHQGALSNIHSALTNAYKRVLRFDLPIVSSNAADMCDAIKDYGFSPPWSTSTNHAKQTTFEVSGWIAGGYKPLIYSPMTWLNGPWQPANIGMVYEWKGPFVKVVTNKRVWKQFARVDVVANVNTNENGYYLSTDVYYSVYNTSNKVTRTIATNEVLITDVARLKNSTALNSSGVDIPMISANYYPLVGTPYTVPCPYGDHFTVTHGSNTYDCTEMGEALLLDGYTSTNFSDVVSLTYTSIRSQLIPVEYDPKHDFPFYSRHQYRGNRTCMLWGEETTGSNYVGSSVSGCTRERSTDYSYLGFRTQLNYTHFPYFQDRASSHLDALNEVCEQSPVFYPARKEWLTTWYVDKYPTHPNAVFCWDFTRVPWTEDFENFHDEKLDSHFIYDLVPEIDDPPNEHKCEMELRAAAFGLWRFAKWAYNNSSY